MSKKKINKIVTRTHGVLDVDNLFANKERRIPYTEVCAMLHVTSRPCVQYTY